MSKQALEKKIETLAGIRSAPASVAVAELRKALRDRSNYVVSKAAAHVADLSLPELVPDLVTAFERFLADPTQSDPQCWAKNAIAQALKDLAHRDAEVFLRGLVHVQLEPVWGGKADSAMTLRGICALALIDCRLDDLGILTHLIPGLADPAPVVRIDTALAIARLGSRGGALLLRLKILLGDEDPEVMGQCFASLLSIEPGEAVAFVSKFLSATDDNVASEAAGALAQSRAPEAIRVLKTMWKKFSPQVREAVLASLRASSFEEAADFLLHLIANEAGEVAARAIAALAASRFHQQFRERAAAVVEHRGDPILRSAWERAFPIREDK